MIDKKLVDILACPETRQPVRIADHALVASINARIDKGEVRNREGKVLQGHLDGGLVRHDSTLLYPIEGGIPLLVVDRAIPLKFE